MATVSYIKVIVPLRLEWEPLYSYEYDGISSFPLAEGTRVTVPVASRTYVAVVSCADAGEEANKEHTEAPMMNVNCFEFILII